MPTWSAWHSQRREWPRLPSSSDQASPSHYELVHVVATREHPPKRVRGVKQKQGEPANPASDERFEPLHKHGRLMIPKSTPHHKQPPPSTMACFHCTSNKIKREQHFFCFWYRVAPSLCIEAMQTTLFNFNNSTTSGKKPYNYHINWSHQKQTKLVQRKRLNTLEAADLSHGDSDLVFV
jgi:hypothetical protein